MKSVDGQVVVGSGFLRGGIGAVSAGMIASKRKVTDIRAVVLQIVNDDFDKPPEAGSVDLELTHSLQDQSSQLITTFVLPT